MRLALCLAVGTLIDQWLFWQMITTGGFQIPANVIAAWKSGWLVAPSPRKPMDTVSCPSFLAAIAAPTAWGTCGPMHELQHTWFTWRLPWWLGICRPFCTSPLLP